MGVLKGITAEAEDEDMKDITCFTSFLHRMEKLHAFGRGVILVCRLLFLML
jgi:hypothetical protein